MSESMTIHASHFWCIKSAVLKGLQQIYIDGSCPGLGIGIKISDASVGPAVIDPYKGCCILRCTIINAYHFRAGDKLRRPTKESFHVLSFDDTEEKVAVRFEGEQDQDVIYEITLYKYLNPDNELPID